MGKKVLLIIDFVPILFLIIVHESDYVRQRHSK